jgi:predicted DNA-binding protein (MmcQ/YjbR family)
MKEHIDELLLKLPGVSARRIGSLDAYVVADKMFACVGDKGMGLRLPANVATELQFSCQYIKSYAPGGMASTREWVQVEFDKPEDLAKDMDLVQQSLKFVKKGRR